MGQVTVFLGYFTSEKKARALCGLLSGETYMKFIAVASPEAGNWGVYVSTLSDVMEDELFDMVAFVLADELAKKLTCA